MATTDPSLPSRSDTDIKGTGLVHDICETLTGFDHVARCPDCGRESLWAERRFLTHADGCEVAD